jgi:hypothetical protein
VISGPIADGKTVLPEIEIPGAFDESGSHVNHHNGVQLAGASRQSKSDGGKTHRDAGRLFHPYFFLPEKRYRARKIGRQDTKNEKNSRRIRATLSL